LAKILVVGIGNLLLRDEGVGVHVVNRLAAEGLPEEVEAVDGGTCTYDLVDLLCQAEKILVVDAVKADQEPGTLYRASLANLGLEEKQAPVSFHDLSFMDAVRMAEMLGHKPEIVVLGVEPEVIDWGTELSPKIEAKIPKLLELIRQEICCWLTESK